MENKCEVTEMEIFEVTDIYLNAYLLSDSFKYVDITVKEETNRKTVIFCYAKTDELVAAIKDYKENEFLHAYIKKYLYTKRAITTTLRNC